MNSDFDVVGPHAVVGKAIAEVYLINQGWKTLPCKTKVPTAKFLRNYDLIAGAERFLVLDNYGQDYLSESMLTRLFGDATGFDLAIDYKTAEIYRVHYNKHKNGKYSIGLLDFEPKAYLPKQYLGQLEELKAKKRPWHLSIWEQALYNFIDQEEGYEHLRQNLIIGFDFRPNGIEVFVRDGDASFYREIGRGKGLEE